MGERFIAGSNVRRVTKHASRPAIDVLFFLPPRPWVGSPFDIHPSAGRRFLGPQWSLDPSRRFESKRDPKAGSGEGSVAANWRRSGKTKRSQAFAWTPEHRDVLSRD
jgi:hypothetical protein